MDFYHNMLFRRIQEENYCNPTKPPCNPNACGCRMEMDTWVKDEQQKILNELTQSAQEMRLGY